MSSTIAVPGQWRGAYTVWQRNLLVWYKMLGPSLFINFGEPFLYLVGLGYGLGMFIGASMEMPYLTFLASGILASSAMNTASFEAMYSVYTRMVPQRSYEAMLATPVDIGDILIGEMLWCATKSLITGGAILLVAALLGAVADLRALWVLPILFLAGLTFAGPALIMTAWARGYDFFSYYSTLLLTPMFLLSGVFYPVSSLPPALQQFVQLLPLTHAVDLIRPLVAGRPVGQVPLHLLVLAVYAVIGYAIAARLIRRRMLV